MVWAVQSNPRIPWQPSRGQAWKRPTTLFMKGNSYDPVRLHLNISPEFKANNFIPSSIIEKTLSRSFTKLRHSVFHRISFSYPQKLTEWLISNTIKHSVLYIKTEWILSCFHQRQIQSINVKTIPCVEIFYNSLITANHRI